MAAALASRILKLPNLSSAQQGAGSNWAISAPVAEVDFALQYSDEQLAGLIKIKFPDTTAAANQGWIRDLTRECVEPNPGPATWVEIYKKALEYSGRDEAFWKPVNDYFESLIGGATHDDVTIFLENPAALVDNMKDDRYKRIVQMNLEKATKFLLKEENAPPAAANQGKKIQNFSQFWENLPKYESSESTIDFIHILYPSQPKLVYIREGWKDLLTKIENKESILLGNPGIGKSTFALFLLSFWKTNNPASIAVYCSTQGQMSIGNVGFKDGVAYSLSDDQVGQFVDKDSLLIVDGRVPPNLPFERPKMILLSCSPKRDHWYSFSKTNPSIFVMSVWSENEMEELRSKSYPEVTKEDLDRRYLIWGGVPRLCFNKGEVNESVLQTEILRINNLPELKSSLGNCALGDEAPHSVFHIRTPNYKPVNYYHGEHFIDFASPFVVDLVVQKMREIVPDFLENAIRAITEPSLGVLRGRLFEPYSHHRLASGGKFQEADIGYTRSTDLNGAPTDPFKMTIPLLQNELDSFGIKYKKVQKKEYYLELVVNNRVDEKIETVAAPPERVWKDVSFETSKVNSFSTYEEINGEGYWKPTSKIWKSIDSFLWPNIFFQITVSDKHSLLANEIPEMWKLVKRAMSKEENPTMFLYFVVPPETSKAYQKPMEPLQSKGQIKDRLSDEEKESCSKLFQKILKIDLNSPNNYQISN